MRSWDGKTELVFLSCPFCGYLPKIEHIGNDHTRKKSLRVKCSNVGCRVERTDSTLKFDFSWLESVALTAWNNRDN